MPPGRKSLPPEQKAQRRREALERYAEKHRGELRAAAQLRMRRYLVSSITAAIVTAPRRNRERIALSDAATIQSHKIDVRRHAQQYRDRSASQRFPAALAQVVYHRHREEIRVDDTIRRARMHMEAHTAARRDSPDPPKARPHTKPKPLKTAPTKLPKTPKPVPRAPSPTSSYLCMLAQHEKNAAALPKAAQRHRKAVLDTPCPPRRLSSINGDEEDGGDEFSSDDGSDDDYRSAPMPGFIARADHRHENKATHIGFWAITAGAGDFVGIWSSQAPFERILAEHANLLSFYADSWLEVSDMWAVNCADYHNHEGEGLPPPPPPPTQPRRQEVTTHFLPHNLSEVAANMPAPEPLPEDSALPLVWISDDEDSPPTPPPEFHRTVQDTIDMDSEQVAAHLRDWELKRLFSRTGIEAFAAHRRAEGE
ncbi:hypothetical protein C8R43DRAFT_955215 [Mycena crocata]|nr:hypothetical protein C8R43DRAFT_955215 [Mycena crocata]